MGHMNWWLGFSTVEGFRATTLVVVRVITHTTAKQVEMAAIDRKLNGIEGVAKFDSPCKACDGEVLAGTQFDIHSSMSGFICEGCIFDRDYPLATTSTIDQDEFEVAA